MVQKRVNSGYRNRDVCECALCFTKNKGADGASKQPPYAPPKPKVPVITLKDGKQMPALGLGTWLGIDSQQNRIKPEGKEVELAVLWALDAGYTHIDTAQIYGIEDQVGQALTKKFSQGLKREDIFVTTKLYIDAHAKDLVIPTLLWSLKDLNLEYVDLYLIHWPVGHSLDGKYDSIDYLETWQGMVEAKCAGLSKSIGVSNFNQQQIARLIDKGREKPAVLQIEVNLNLQQPKLLEYCKNQNIAVMGYTPFGSLLKGEEAKDAPPPRIDDPALVEMAKKHNKIVPQIVLQYLIELGVVPLPKSVNKTRIGENLNVFDFELTSPERELLKGFDKNYRIMSKKNLVDHPSIRLKRNKLSQQFYEVLNALMSGIHF